MKSSGNIDLIHKIKADINKLMLIMNLIVLQLKIWLYIILYIILWLEDYITLALLK